MHARVLRLTDPWLRAGLPTNLAYAVTELAARMDRPYSERAADARATLARALAAADPDDLPCLPDATRVEGGPVGGRRFPWKIALQFAAARDLAVLARTHRAARAVCNHRATVERIVKARHGRGCKRASDKKQDCRCAGCARVALLLGPATAKAPSRLGAGAGSDACCWLRRLDHTERAAAWQAGLRPCLQGTSPNSCARFS